MAQRLLRRRRPRPHSRSRAGRFPPHEPMRPQQLVHALPAFVAIGIKTMGDYIAVVPRLKIELYRPFGACLKEGGGGSYIGASPYAILCRPFGACVAGRLAYIGKMPYAKLTGVRYKQSISTSTAD